jgi:hypothetical protein
MMWGEASSVRGQASVVDPFLPRKTRVVVLYLTD